MESAANPTFTCASCQSPFDWAPLFYRGFEYCCAGCASGGPCCCSYDGHRSEVFDSEAPLPMVAHEWEKLVDEADRLRSDLARAIERRHIDIGMPRNEAAEAIPVWEIEPKQHRLAVVEDVLRRADVTEPGDRPVIGAAVTAQATGGETEHFMLVPPGEGDPTLGRVPLDSPFGQLLSRCEIGSSFAMMGANGSRRMTVVAISYPGIAQAAGDRTPATVRAR